MRIVFMGTPEFAVPSLDILIKNGFDIKAVVTATDKPKGRGQQLSISPVKEYALQNNLPVLQPTDLRDPGFHSALKSLQPDLILVVAFRKLPKEVWAIPSKGTVNLHASLLPQYRGAAPINRAIINGETETGVTTFFINDAIDTGNIIYQEKCEITATDTAGTLHDKLMITGANLVLKTTQALEKGHVETTSQAQLISDTQALKTAPKINKDECQIIWDREVNEVYNFIRGMSPVPGAYTHLTLNDSEKFYLKIYRSEIVTTGVPIDKPGSINTDNKGFLHIATKNGWISLLEIQLAGKKKLSVKEFLKGFLINNDWKAKYLT